MALPLDTGLEMHRLQLESLRRLTETERLRMAFQLSSLVWTLARQAFAERYHDLLPDEQHYRFLATQYGKRVAALWWKAKTGQDRA